MRFVEAIIVVSHYKCKSIPVLDADLCLVIFCKLRSINSDL